MHAQQCLRPPRLLLSVSARECFIERTEGHVPLTALQSNRNSLKHNARITDTAGQDAIGLARFPSHMCTRRGERTCWGCWGDVTAVLVSPSLPLSAWGSCRAASSSDRQKTCTVPRTLEHDSSVEGGLKQSELICAACAPRRTSCEHRSV
jgi:hypothetical protein